jgi:hypothetical protein
MFAEFALRVVYIGYVRDGVNLVVVGEGTAVKRMKHSLEASNDLFMICFRVLR